MILFGAPRRSNNHAEEAAMCGIKMQERVAELQGAWQKITHRPLRIRVGLATGKVFVGNLGGAGHIEFSAIGRNVNLAARLESGSEIGGVLMSKECYDKLSEKPVGWWRKVALKGYDDLVKVWQVPPLGIDLRPEIDGDISEMGIVISEESYESLKEKPDGKWVEVKLKTQEELAKVYEIDKMS